MGYDAAKSRRNTADRFGGTSAVWFKIFKRGMTDGSGQHTLKLLFRKRSAAICCSIGAVLSLGTMIHYEHGSWGICFLWQVKGSTLPKGLVWALPWAAVSGGLCYLRAEAGVGIERIDAGTLLGAYGFFISLLAFMVAFRNNQGWSRYWEGATLLQQTRGEWFNAISSCFAFCNPQPEHKEKVVQFQDRA